MPAQMELDFDKRERSTAVAVAALRRLQVQPDAVKFLEAVKQLQGDSADGVECPLETICRAVGITKPAARAAIEELVLADFLILKIEPGRVNFYAVNWKAVFGA